MTGKRVSDGPDAVNVSDTTNVSPEPALESLAPDLLEIQDQIEDNIASARALLEVAYMQGLENCHSNTQQRYLMIIEELLAKAVQEVQQLRQVLK